MKRILIVLLCMMMVMPACVAEAAKPVVAVSNYPLAIVVERIMGDDAEIINLSDANVDANAEYDAVVVFGNEEWIADVKEGVTVVPVMNALILLDKQGNVWAEGAEIDANFWLAPVNMAMAGFAVSEALIAIDADNAETYSENADTYLHEMIDLDTQIREILEGKAGAEVKSEDGSSVAYFASEFGLTQTDHDHANTIDVIAIENELDYSTRMLENAKIIH